MSPAIFEGFHFDSALIFVSALLVISVLASRLSSAFGVPSLLLFLGLGMLAGSEGPGRLPFENFELAYVVGSLGLAFIIFDGGIRTNWRKVYPALRPGSSLSVFGTLITAILVAVFAHWFLRLEVLPSLLLGAIVSSTDAAAVFSLLRSKGLSLKGELKETLEVEAGSNDPVAIFLTLSILNLMVQPAVGWLFLLGFFLQQTLLGTAFGWFGAQGMRWLINRAGVEFEGLYGVLMVGMVGLLFASTNYLGGSGFLAVYVAGVALGHFDFLHKSTVVRFLDGIAWVSQIALFLVLGLLVFPSHLLQYWREGLYLTLFMIFVARPFSVWIALAPFRRFSRNQRSFVCWVGLRGAAPIILATLPAIQNLEGAEFYFNLVFFLVLISVLLQGISIPAVARFLGVIQSLPLEEAQMQSEGVLPEGFQSIEFTVNENAPAHQQRVVDLGLPAGVLLTSIRRQDRFLVPQGETVLQSGDLIRGLARESSVEELQTIFGRIT